MEEKLDVLKEHYPDRVEDINGYSLKISQLLDPKSAFNKGFKIKHNVNVSLLTFILLHYHNDARGICIHEEDLNGLFELNDIYNFRPTIKAVAVNKDKTIIHDKNFVDVSELNRGVKNNCYVWFCDWFYNYLDNDINVVGKVN